MCWYRCSFISLFSLVGMAHAQTILSFESPSDFVKPTLETTQATVSQSTQGVTDGAFAVLASFNAAPTAYPAFNYVFAQPADFSTAGLIGIDATNFGSVIQRFNLLITDAAGVKLETYFDVKPGETRPCALVLNQDTPAQYGLRGLPLYLNGLNLSKASIPATFNLSQIRKIGIYLRKPALAATMAFDNIRMSPTFSWLGVLTGTVDRFGQRTWGNVPGKVASISDLTSRLAGEAAQLSAATPYTDRTEIGSWKTGPNMTNQSGYFKLAKYKYKWYFLAPDGLLFFSSGLGGLTATNVPTRVTGREYMFSWLPQPKDLEAPFLDPAQWNGADITTYDFTGANIFNKYGDTSTQWAATAANRQLKWGFNTTGCYVDYIMWSVPNRPFTVELVTDPSAKRFAVQNSTKTMVDPFDAGFPAAIDPQINKLVARYSLNTNVNLIGYTTDNELGFRTQGSEIDMPISVLKLDGNTWAIKAAFATALKNKYSTIANLNTAWGTAYTGWGPFLLPSAVSVQNAAFVDDMHAFVVTVAKKYFTLWKQSIRKYDLNHMYLGSKMDYLSADLITGMKDNVNVISLNRYAKSLDSDLALLDQFDFPFYLSEYSASCARGNNFAVGVSSAMVDSQAERADVVEYVLRQAIANKNCVGAHFFRLYDDPVTGSYKDGNNGNWGLCDVTDTPYAEMVAMFRRVNADIYKR